MNLIWNLFKHHPPQCSEFNIVGTKGIVYGKLITQT